MDEREYIKVYVDFEKGKTVCICARERKGCRKDCEPEVVERDKYRNWQETFKQDKFGKSHERQD